MNKKDLARRIAKEADITLVKADELIGVFSKVIMEGMIEGDEVKLPGIGKFYTEIRGARTFRDPRNGEAVEVAECNRVKFKVFTGTHNKLI